MRLLGLYSHGDQGQSWGPRTAVGTEDSRRDRGQPRGPSPVMETEPSHGGRAQSRRPRTAAHTGSRYQQFRWGFQLLWIICIMTPFSELSSLRSDHSSEPTPASFETRSCQIERP